MLYGLFCVSPGDSLQVSACLLCLHWHRRGAIPNGSRRMQVALPSGTTALLCRTLEAEGCGCGPKVSSSSGTVGQRTGCSRHPE